MSTQPASHGAAAVIDGDADLNLAAAFDVTERALQLAEISRGQLWTEDEVTLQICGHIKNQVASIYEIGRLLTWSKAHLGHGTFGTYCARRLPWLSQSTINRYMRSFAFLDSNPALLQRQEQLGLKKVLLLATLPPEEVDVLTSGGSVGEVDLEQVGELPYPALKKQLAEARRAQIEAEEHRGEAEREAERLRKRVDALVDLTVSDDDDALLADLKVWHQKFDGALALAGMGLDILARRVRDDELSGRVRAEAAALVEYMRARVDHEVLRFRALSGGEVFDYQFDEVAGRRRPLVDRYPIPAGRELPRVEADAPSADAPARRATTPPLSVVRDDGPAWIIDEALRANTAKDIAKMLDSTDDAARLVLDMWAAGDTREIIIGLLECMQGELPNGASAESFLDEVLVAAGAEQG